MAWYPGAIRKVVTRHTTLMARYRGVCNHVAVSEAASLFGYFDQVGNPTSHFYVRKDGVTEQYVNTLYRAPAQLEGNPSMISVETQGGVTDVDHEPWTAAQVERLASIASWCHTVHGIPLVRMADSLPATVGIGYHRLGVDPYRVDGGELWSKSYGKICPGGGKIAQIPGIITRAKSLALEDDMPTAQEVVDLLLNTSIPAASGGTKTVKACLGEAASANDADGHIVTVINMLNEDGSIKESLDSIRQAIAALPIGAGDLTQAQVQAACDAAIRARFADVDGV